MADLISELKKDHDQIKQLLSNVYDYIANNEKKIEFVNQLKDILKIHIENEDKKIYRFLFKEAKKDDLLKSKLDIFVKDWKEISAFTTYYIEKYGAGNFDEKFTTDTAKLMSSIRQRIIKEEVSLFPEYLKKQ